MQEHPVDAEATIDGYRAPQVCNLVGISYRQLDYWARTGLIRPSIQSAHGSGSQRLYSFTDIVQLKVVKRLLDAGMSLKRIRSAMEILRAQLDSDAPLADVTLLSDGTTIYAAHSPDEVVDVFRRGQGVFGIAVGPVQQELEGELLKLFPEAGDGGGHSGGARQLSTTDEYDQAPADLVEFAHESERQFARLLDFYDVEWEYEPTSPSPSGAPTVEPTEFFRPDFYLPEDDMFIEITTMNQKLVTKKNKKVRLLRELYPEVTCKIFYQRDYLNLLVKYELDEIADQELPATPTRIPGPPVVVDLGAQEYPRRRRRLTILGCAARLGCLRCERRRRGGARPGGPDAGDPASFSARVARRTLHRVRGVVDAAPVRGCRRRAHGGQVVCRGLRRLSLGAGSDRRRRCDGPHPHPVLQRHRQGGAGQGAVHDGAQRRWWGRG